MFVLKGESTCGLLFLNFAAQKALSRLRETFVFRVWWLQPLPGRQPSLPGGPFSPRDTAAPSGKDRTAPRTAQWAQMSRARHWLPLTHLPVLFSLLAPHRSGARCRRATPTRRPRCGAHCPQDFGSREEPGEEPGLRQRAHL